VLHILAVIAHVALKRDNIIKAMFTGKKSVLPNEAANLHADEKTSIKSSKMWLAIVIIIALCALLAAVILTAPESVTSMDY
jgi:hypothetical protein